MLGVIARESLSGLPFSPEVGRGTLGPRQLTIWAQRWPRATCAFAVATFATALVAPDRAAAQVSLGGYESQFGSNGSGNGQFGGEVQLVRCLQVPAGLRKRRLPRWFRFGPVQFSSFDRDRSGGRERVRRRRLEQPGGEIQPRRRLRVSARLRERRLPDWVRSRSFNQPQAVAVDKVRMHKIGRLKIRIKLTDANGSSTVLVTPTSPH
jgi:hypothetical protein